MPYNGFIPMGYHKVERSRKGLVIAGAATFGGLYGITLLGALSGPSNGYSLAIPVIGPFTLIETSSGGSWSGLYAIANAFLVLDGLGQAAGVIMFAAGLSSKKTVLVRNDVTAFEPEFMVGPGSVGMRMKF